VSATALVTHQPAPAPPFAPQEAFAVARLPPVALDALLDATKVCVQPEPSLPWQTAEAIACSALVWALALVAHHPEPAPPVSPQLASAVARLPPVVLSAELDAAMLCRQVAPLLPWQVAEVWAPAAVAPTWLTPVHCPFAPAVQPVLEAARLTPPGAAARAVPSVWVRQPVPVQLLATSVTPASANPLVAAWQAPAASQEAVALPRTSPLPAATVSVVDEVRVAQPDSVPLSQTAAT
jgi:hypothetical protein